LHFSSLTLRSSLYICYCMERIYSLTDTCNHRPPSLETVFASMLSLFAVPVYHVVVGKVNTV
jgi:hypothetical protein